MKIEDVKKLDDGVSGITIEGKIIKTPKEPRDSEFGWSQMIILKDDTDEIGSWINIESAEDAYKVGQYIKIKGKVSKYVKGGKPGISLNNGNVIDEIKQVNEGVSQEQPISQPIEPTQKTTQKPVQKQEYTNNDYWHDKTLRDIENNKCIVRECAIKAVTELAVSDMEIIGVVDKLAYFDFAEEIVDYIYGNGYCKTKGITSEAITKEFGGTATEEKPENSHDNSEKDQKIAKAKEIVNQASQAQKDMVEKIIKSRYITEKEVKNIGDLTTITKENASKYISYWFGNDGSMGERDKRELAEEEKNPLAEKIHEDIKTIEKVDSNDTSSLVKDLLVEAIYKQRKELHLEDNEKFEKTIGYNPKLEELTEEKLLKLKSLLKDWRPDWVKS